MGSFGSLFLYSITKLSESVMPSGKGTYGKKVGRPSVKRKTGAKPMKPAKKGKK